MPVPLYLSGVVIIFAFPRSKSGIFDLILEKIPGFRSDTIHRTEHYDPSRYRQAKILASIRIFDIRQYSFG